MIKIITSAQLDSYRRLKDKSVSLRFITGEKSSNEIMGIDSILDSFGYLYYKPESQLTKEEIQQLDEIDTDLFDNPKTQSQRIRNVLYKYWETRNTGFKDFKEFYKAETERIISHYKSKIV